MYQQVLTEKLQPDSIAIIDESDQHAGHAGHHGGGASHLRLHIVGAAFEGLSRLARHRLVYDILNPWMLTMILEILPHSYVFAAPGICHLRRIKRLIAYQ